MTNTPAYYRARIALINRLIASESNELYKAQLAQGYIPEVYQHETIDPEGYSNEPLTDLEMATYATWFAVHPDKVLGEYAPGSGWINPVVVKGSLQDAVQRANAQLPDDNTTKSSNPDNTVTIKADPIKQAAKTTMKAKEPTAEIKLSSSEIATLSEKLNQKKERNESPIMSFEEVVRTYNQGISDDEIKAWVWYKRQFGNPMRGFESWYLKAGKQGSNEILITTKTTTLLDNAFRPAREVMAGTVLGLKTKFKNEYQGINYVIVKSEFGELLWVNEADTKAQKSENTAEISEIDALVLNKALVYFNGQYMPVPVFTFGNMYEREREVIKSEKEIVQKYGKEVYDRTLDLVKKAKPEMLRVENPDISQRPKILALSKLAITLPLNVQQEQGQIETGAAYDGFAVTELAFETGLDLQTFRKKTERGTKYFTLVKAFEIWLNVLRDSDIKGSNKHNIIKYYLENGNPPAELEGSEKQKIKDNAKIAGEQLFTEFLAKGLRYEDQQKLNYRWNSEFNTFSDLNYLKVPVGFECSRTFKNSLLAIKPVQRNGVAFLSIVGSGCLAYDVGVGKTMTQIVAIAQALSTGSASRILLVVPKPTYKKWQRELFGYYTDGKNKSFTPIEGYRFMTGILSGTKYTFNDFFNLSEGQIKKLKKEGVNFNTKVPAGSVTMVTYEGFTKIGFSEKVFDTIFKSILDTLKNGGSEQRKGRGDAVDESKFLAMMGKGRKGTVVDIDVLGFDYLAVDEAHNFKNVFESVGRDEDSKRNLFGLSATPSSRALKLFFQTQYIQRTFGKNVSLLTATPFTNSPLEIFSMISFIGYEQLKAYNLQNIRRFFETFVMETVEYVVTMEGELEARPVIKQYNNKLVLQRLLYNMFDYKTGADAQVKRPCKINIPYLKHEQNGALIPLPQDEQIPSYLEMTEWQKANQAKVKVMAGLNQRTNHGAMFRAMHASTDNAFSPYLFAKEMPESAIDFVKSSPKIDYTMRCIALVKQYHESRGENVSGQIIYSNRGKDYFHYIKEYLEDEIGYKKRVRFGDVVLDEVEILTGGSSSEQEEKHRDNVKEGFLAGVVKIIIGTATIREGIDLQERGSVIYDLYPEWNPTDIKQLEGRIYRQGNLYGYVRFVMPLVKNSMDLFVFQKLEEKQSRINDLWNRADRSNVAELDSLDPEEIKYALLDNAAELTEMKVGKALKVAESQLQNTQENLKMYGQIADVKFNYEKFYNAMRQKVTSDFDVLNKFFTANEARIKTLSENKEENKERIKNYAEMNEKVKEVTDKISEYMTAVPQIPRDLLDIASMIDRRTWMVKGEREYANVGNFGWEFRMFKDYYSKAAKIERQILSAYGLTIDSDLSNLLEELKKAESEAQLLVDEIKSAEYVNKVMQEVQAELDARNQLRGELEEQVAKFAKTNVVLGYAADNVNKDGCPLPIADAPPLIFDEDSDIEYSNDDDDDDEVVVTKQKEPVSESSLIEQYKAGIAAYELLLEMADTDEERTEYQNGIDAYQLLLEMEEDLA